MRQKKAYRFRSGLTLVEVMLAVAVIIVAALGTLCFEYLSIDHVRFARAQMTATRIGQLLIEDWKSTGGDDNYNPEDLNMGFSLPPDVGMGDSMTIVDGLPLYITTDMEDVASDALAGITLRRITVSVKWKKDFSSRAVDDDDPRVTLNTYVRRDQ